MLITTDATELFSFLSRIQMIIILSTSCSFIEVAVRGGMSLSEGVCGQRDGWFTSLRFQFSPWRMPFQSDLLRFFSIRSIFRCPLLLLVHGSLAVFSWAQRDKWADRDAVFLKSLLLSISASDSSSTFLLLAYQPSFSSIFLTFWEATLNALLRLCADFSLCSDFCVCFLLVQSFFWRDVACSIKHTLAVAPDVTSAM